MRCRFLVSSLLLLVLCVVTPSAARAQTPGTGAVRGRIVDASGAPVAAAEITVTNEATGFSRPGRSDERGLYTIPQLPLTGTYRFQVAHEGFASQERTGLQ